MRLTVAALLVACLVLPACSTVPKSESAKQALEADAEQAIARIKSVDPKIQERFFDTSVGYAVFPSVGKGAIGVGGAYGRGLLYEDGASVGYCDLTQGSIGFQLGGQAYGEIIFFDSDATLSEFKEGTMEFAAQASAVAATADASANASYEHGVAVFTFGAKGLMYEASIGGQYFDYEPK